MRLNPLLLQTISRIGALLLGLILALGSVEIGYRLLKPTLAVKSKSDRPLFYYHPNSSDDMRDFDYDQLKSTETFRVAVVGDSFTFAPLMQFDDAFPKRLERILRSSVGPKKFEVINFGTPGDSMVDHVRTVKEALTYSPDIILLEITLNDIQLKAFDSGDFDGRYRFGKARLEGYQKTLAQYWKTFGFVLRRLHNSATQTDYVNYFLDQYSNAQAWKAYSTALRRIKKLTDSQGVKLTAAIFPLFGHPFDASYPFHTIHRQIGEELSKLQISYTDLFPVYEMIPLHRLQVEPGVDIHPNEIAHRLAAENIYNWFRENHLLPNQAMVMKRYPFRLNPVEYTRKEMRAKRRVTSKNNS